ncbi:hypothetical protein GCM10009788_50360 [Nocardioides humi]|uniref:Uncharacterized protein n=1 Tax=Nocardioides humi TaxID=449461 RepID=A0ABN2BJN7_9ACTN
MRASQGGVATADRASFERCQRGEVRARGATYGADFKFGTLALMGGDDRAQLPDGGGGAGAVGAVDAEQ